ncbi:MAG: HlyU family transcriptional regulator [Pseudomonadota bacterium]
MVSFLKKLFGGSGSGGGGNAGPMRSEPIEYKGLMLQAAPEPEGDQWRLAGYVLKGDGEEQMERKFLRADLFSSQDEAIEFAIRKGKQIIDEQGARLFADNEKTGRA